MLECSLQDQTVTADLMPGSLLARLYGTDRVVENTTCSYGLAPWLQHNANEHGMRSAAPDPPRQGRARERGPHPLFGCERRRGSKAQHKSVIAPANCGHAHRLQTRGKTG